MDSFELNYKIEMITEDEDKIFGMIYDIVDDKLHISVTSDDKNMKFLYVGDLVRCIVFNDSTGTSFDATVSNRIPGSIPIYELSNICNLTEVQRRQDVRVDCNMDVLCSMDKTLLNLEKLKVEELQIDDIKGMFNTVRLSDLSGGGLRFTSYDRVDSLALMFFLSLEDDELFVKGSIVSHNIKLTPRGSFYSYGVKFIDISEKEKDRIIKFLFVLMRRNRLK